MRIWSNGVARPAAQRSALAARNLVCMYFVYMAHDANHRQSVNLKLT